MQNTAATGPMAQARTRLRRTLEVATVFLKIGVTGFGEPATLIAMTQDEVVQRRKWLTREHFVDIVGITNLIPGPNATEIAIMVGYLYAGWLGLLAAGVSVVLPAAIISCGLSWMYVEWGALPAVAPLFLGIKPVVVTIVLAAVWRMGGTITRDWRLVIITVATALASLSRGNEIAALLLGGGAGCHVAASVTTWRHTKPNSHEQVDYVIFSWRRCPVWSPECCMACEQRPHGAASTHPPGTLHTPCVRRPDISR